MARKPKNDRATFKCEVANIWTSKGKMVKGEEMVLDADEISALEKAQKEMMEAK